jgi:GH15 family glucan-1,4-alpha-glucosidase
VAYAMDLAGSHDSARSYHRWVVNVIDRYKFKIPLIKQALKNTKPLKDEDFLFTRYTFDGREDINANWGNFQIDGYGTWLWAACGHFHMTGDKTWLKSVERSLGLIVEYLQLVWCLPNYDCWEENPDLLHSYSIASAYGGLRAVLKLIGEKEINLDPAPIQKSMGGMKDFIRKYGVFNEELTKHINLDLANNPDKISSVDASLLGAAIPGMLFPLDNPVMINTISSIQQKLVSPDGGVYRYKRDSYYGGGQWVLLTAWLGWVECKIGQHDLAGKRLEWIEKQTDENDWLPEQVPHNLLAPKSYNKWLDNWGEIAKPLLWSHAMYMILYLTLNPPRNFEV